MVCISRQTLDSNQREIAESQFERHQRREAEVEERLEARTGAPRGGRE
jgi:hypothetical protein